MCKTAFSILIERVSKYLLSVDGTMEVRFEMSGKKEDKAIVRYAKELKAVGMPFDPEYSARYSALGPEDFKRVFLGEPRGKKKWNNGTQIADLFLYPMVKRKYDSKYLPWVSLYEAKRVIDAALPEVAWSTHGIKYSCFDEIC